MLRNWRFKPGLKEGVPVSTGATVNLFWGARTLAPAALRDIRAGWNPEALGSNACMAGAPTVAIAQDPIYTGEALSAGLEGSVAISLVVGAGGEPQDLHIVGTPLGMGLDEKALEAVRTWSFKLPVPNRRAALVKVNFRLPGSPPPPGKSPL